MEFENLLTLIKTVSESELTSFTMKDGDLKISMGKEKQVVVEEDLEYALSNSLGFGGHNASILVKKWGE